MSYKNNFLANMLALHRLPGMGPSKFSKLIDQYKFADRDTDKNFLQNEIFAKDDQCLIFTGKADWAAVDRDLHWAEKENHHILTICDEHYPKLLKQIHAPPPVLFVVGDIPLLSKPQIALVGSRNPTHLGYETAGFFAQALAKRGLCITSGLAFGIDSASHRAALKAEAKTIAVLANGLDSVYPKRNTRLAVEIIEGGGALMSEFPIGTLPQPSHFPRRNRIISGLSMGTLVVEATLHSGSLITAKYAVEQGREVFAIPGSINSSQAKGCHVLIRQGAKLVETPQDVLEEMESLLKYVSGLPESIQPMAEEEQRQAIVLDTLDRSIKAKALDQRKEGKEEAVLSCIGFEPTSFDTLKWRSGLMPSLLSSILLELEFQGEIEACVGGYRRRLQQA